MIAKNLPGINDEHDRDKLIQSVEDSVYWYRRMGNNKAADLMEQTIKALSQIKFE